MRPEGVATTWVFDVDGCLVDSLTGTSLRPEAVAVLEHLRVSAADVVLWSAGGADYAERRARELGIDALFTGFQAKTDRDDRGRYRAGHFLECLVGAVFVDDRPEDLPADAEVLAVSPYLANNPHDRGLRPVARRAGLVA